MLRVFITDDHEIFSKGLAKILSLESDMEVVGSVHNGEKLLEALAQMEIDVLLLDVQLPDKEPEVLISEIRKYYPSLPVMYLTLLRGTRFVHRLMKYNIQGYVLKNAPLEELTFAIRTVAQGQLYFSPEINITGVEDDHKNTLTFPNEKIAEILSNREIEIMKLVCQEYSSADIAAKLFLSISTVDTHRKNILIKLGVNNTVGLVKYALKHGLIS